MNRLQTVALLVTTLAVPAAAYSLLTPAKGGLCFTSGSATFQIVRDAKTGAHTPDFRIKLATADDRTGARPDLRMQLVDSAEQADFVLVDDFSGSDPAPCRSATRIQSVAIENQDARPDVTVDLSAEQPNADYKVYVHSARFSQQDAAALLAALWKTNQRREAAMLQREAEATGSIR